MPSIMPAGTSLIPPSDRCGDGGAENSTKEENVEQRENPAYLRSVIEAVTSFRIAFEEFLELHVENTQLGRGLLPAVWRREGISDGQVAAARTKVDVAAGRASGAPALTNVYFMVEGFGRADPIAVWHSVTLPKPVLEPENILSACGMMTGRLERMIIEAETALAPSLEPEGMHPLIWGSARPLWRDGHYRLALVASAEALVAQLKSRTGRNDTSETSLWQQTFSETDPTPGRPRLRWPGDPADRTVKSMNEGLRGITSGVQLTIRNVATHDQTPLTHTEALERMAVLSLLAKWLETCVLVAADRATGSE
jgi:hypothetical protein